MDKKNLVFVLVLLAHLFSCSVGWSLEPEQINLPMMKKWAKATSLMTVATMGAAYYYKHEADKDFDRSQNLSRTQLERDESYMDYLTDKSASRTLGYFSIAGFILSASLWYRSQALAKDSRSTNADKNKINWSVEINHEKGTVLLAMSKNF